MKKRTLTASISAAVVVIMLISGAFPGSGEPVFADSEVAEAVAETAEEIEAEKAADAAEREETVDATEARTTEFQDMIPVVRTAHRGEAIEVAWERIEGASGYLVYRSCGGDKKKIADTGALSFKDRAVASGKEVTYFVEAYNEETVSRMSQGVSDIIYRVYIETGHGRMDNGRWDPGCRWKRYQEAKLMLPIARFMTKYLRANGVYVYTDADKGNNRNLNWTLDFLSRHSVSAFVNIHCDYKKAKPGTLPLYRTEEQKKLAMELNKGVHSTVKIKDRGLKKRNDLKSLNSKTIDGTACLFETGSIKRDNRLLRTKYDAYGKGLAKGLCSYLDISFK